MFRGPRPSFPSAGATEEDAVETNRRTVRTQAALAALSIVLPVTCAFVVPLRATAAQPYSPVRQGIDDACNAPATSADTQTIYLARLDGAANALWHVTSADTEERSVAAAHFPGGEFATVRARDTVLTAFIVRREPTGDVGRTRNWCFIGGGITRAGAEIVDTVTQIDWHRTQYFDPSLDSSENNVIDRASMTHDAGKKQPPAPLDRLQIDAYKTPADLPFYDVYRAARSAPRHIDRSATSH